MSTFKERLKLAMAGPPKVSQAALARACGVTAPSVNDWVSGKTKTIEGQNLLLAADFLQVAPLWLATGKGRMRKTDTADEDSSQFSGEQSNVEMAEQPTRMYRYPVVSEVAAGAWAEVVEPYPNGYSDRYEATDYKAKGPAFWLEVVGDSMTAPSGTSVPEGMLILVDTGVEARPGKLVVAKLPSSNDVTFKKLIDDAGQLYLKPLNPGYSMIKCTDDCKIIGVAVRVTGFL
ncbi:LexA family protein [Pseudomonas cannabina]|uniref:Helix-turn-helix domain-containing protein n=1 Tax=Pseudomonas syringae pv. maculicola str. ES4326 TaxID=629265 RepID=A0A8T8BZW6_PSEYM|nr:helix-turn-helix domain-containing protein [Pseudomonas syringae pv. maculicola str. ES4326]QQN20116.1 helix-turn-helix domain-containing protein [Pseudomonas cannabina pv. alisalensis]